MSVEAIAERLKLHPYLAALGVAFVLAPKPSAREPNSERWSIRDAWVKACERYGFDSTTQAELLAEISLNVPDHPEPS